MNKQKILIIEDETINSLHIKNILNNRGYEVCDMGISAEEAINLTKKHNPDLILMDIVLSGEKDGIFAVEEIKKKHDIPIVYCTANSNEETLKRAKKTEPHGYIIKPISREELLSTVEIALYKHEMERKLRGRDKRLNSIIRNIPGMIYRAYPDWSTDIFSNSIEICGYSEIELNRFKSHWLEIIHADDRDKVLKEGAELTREEKEIIQTYRITAKDGSTRWVEDRKISQFSDTGEFMWIDGIVFEISERKNIEEALYKSESRFKDISLSMADWIWEVDENGFFTFVTGKVKEILGYEPEELIGKTSFDLMPHDEAVRKRKILTEIAAEKKPIHDLENWNISKDGRDVCLLTNGVPVLDENGELTGYRGVDKDITDSKKAEDAPRESVDMYRTITENATDIILEMDLDGNITFISPSSSRILGFNSETDLLINMKNLLTPDSYKTAVETIENELIRVKRNIKKNKNVRGKISEPLVLELEYIHKDGSTFPGEITTSFIRDTQGNPVKIAGIIRDISERKKAEEQIKASLKEKEILLKEIHHRVKNNMNIIISIIELEKMNINTSNAGRILDDIKTRIMTISLIHEKLYKSKDIKYIEIAESIKSLSEDIFNIYNPDPGRIALNIDAEHTLLTIDQAIPLGLLLNELLTNIFKYAFPEDHSGPRKITISLNKNDDSTITITVKDNGIGLPHGFDINTVDSLGLTLVDALTKQLKGKLKITGKKGTKVTVTFPGA